jgi:hypothetical protein
VCLELWHLSWGPQLGLTVSLAQAELLPACGSQGDWQLLLAAVLHDCSANSTRQPRQTVSVNVTVDSSVRLLLGISCSCRYGKVLKTCTAAAPHRLGTRHTLLLSILMRHVQLARSTQHLGLTLSPQPSRLACPLWQESSATMGLGTQLAQFRQLDSW